MSEGNEGSASSEAPRPVSKYRWPLALFLIGLAMWIIAFACFGPAFKELRFLALWIPGGMIGITGISMWLIGDEMGPREEPSESTDEPAGDENPDQTED